MEEHIVSCVGTSETMNTEGGESSGKSLASKSKEKKIPHYLRPSTGSCHDLCKYGKRHEPVEKPWRSSTKKVFKKGSVDVLVDTSKPSSSKSKKVMEVEKRKVADDSPEIIKREVVRGGVSSGVKKPEALIISSGDETPMKQMKKKMTLSSKLKPSPDSGSRSSGNVDVLKTKALTKSYSALATSKSKVNNEQVVPKLRMGKTIGGKDEDAKIRKATASSRIVKGPVTPRASLSPRVLVRLAGSSSLRKSQSSKTPSSRLNEKPRRVINRADETNKALDVYPVEEKTLHVVEIETLHDVEPLVQKDDECTVSETEDYEYPSGSNKAESGEEEMGMSNGEKKPRVGDSPEEAARKLQFRRGKVVDADVAGESARKLKFRKGRGLGEDKAHDGQVRRSFKKREDVVEELVDDDGEKVVLRHQDVQERDAQGLFNNVIEETASKLVEARKSKVKALVGAFENVISLLES